MAYGMEYWKEEEKEEEVAVVEGRREKGESGSDRMKVGRQ